LLLSKGTDTQHWLSGNSGLSGKSTILDTRYQRIKLTSPDSYREYPYSMLLALTKAIVMQIKIIT